MLGQCPIFACLGLRTIRMLCEQTQTGEDGVLTEHLPLILKISDQFKHFGILRKSFFLSS
jgi:hypothetical protein